MNNNTITYILSGLMILAVLGWGPSVFAQAPYSEGEFGISSQWSFSDRDNPDENGWAPMAAVGCSMHNPAASGIEYADIYAQGETGIPNHVLVSASITEKASDTRESDYTGNTLLGNPAYRYENCYALLERGGFSQCNVK
jgi:hypothetical protein